MWGKMDLSERWFRRVLFLKWWVIGKYQLDMRIIRSWQYPPLALESHDAWHENYTEGCVWGFVMSDECLTRQGWVLGIAETLCLWQMVYARFGHLSNCQNSMSLADGPCKVQAPVQKAYNYGHYMSEILQFSHGFVFTSSLFLWRPHQKGRGTNKNSSRALGWSYRRSSDMAKGNQLARGECCFISECDFELIQFVI